MAIKGNDSKSWFISCNHLLHKYKLPNIYNLNQSTNSKETLKAESKHKIDNYVSPGLKRVAVNLLSHISTYMTALLEKCISVGNQLIIILEMLDELLSRSKS